MSKSEAGTTGNIPSIRLSQADLIIHALSYDLDRPVVTFEWGSEPVPGILALGLPGHTPGHTGFRISSVGESLTVGGDASNQPAIFALHPDWHAAFDFDGPRAAQSRRSLFTELANSHERVALTHAPFPAIGTLAPVGDGFFWCPEMWQA